MIFIMNWSYFLWKWRCPGSL